MGGGGEEQAQPARLPGRVSCKTWGGEERPGQAALAPSRAARLLTGLA